MEINPEELRRLELRVDAQIYDLILLVSRRQNVSVEDAAGLLLARMIDEESERNPPPPGYLEPIATWNE